MIVFKATDLLNRGLEALGILVDSIKGPNVTRIYEGPVKHQTRQIRPNDGGDWICTHLRSKQIVYLTRYERWWIRDTKQAVYEVSGSVPDEYRTRVVPELFDTITYPMLCTPLLKWTLYPHTYAMIAFLRRILDINDQNKESHHDGA